MSSAILVVPTRATRKALTGDGPLGSRPPTVVRGHLCGHASHQRWAEEMMDEDCYMCRNAIEDALALAWEGRPTGPEGLARALACLAEREGGFDASCGLVWAKRYLPVGAWFMAGMRGADLGSKMYEPGPAPADLGDLIDLWALGVVLVARGIAERVEVLP